MKLKIPGKHHKTLLWAGIAIGVVVLILLARRGGGDSGGGVTTFVPNDATGSGSGGGSSDALLQAKAQAFSTIASMMGEERMAEIQGKTTLGLASIQAAIEESRNATTVALGAIQGDNEARAAAAAEAGARYQTDAQTSAMKAQTNAQEGANKLAFWSSLFGSAAGLAGAYLNSKGRGSYPGSGSTPPGLPGRSGLVYIGTKGDRPKGF